MTTTRTAGRPGLDLLPARTAMGTVTLNVGDLDLMTRYYRDAVLLDVLGAHGDEVVLGRHGVEVLTLKHDPSLPPGSPRSAGLFHTAILFESPEALATAVASVAVKAPGTFTGSADHLVSEAFYFTDPEGNGLELYTDRPRPAWRWTNGQVEMATLYLDPNAYLATHLTDEGRELISTTERGALTRVPGAVVGHVHLQVGDVGTARRFYVDTLGFEVTIQMPSALFVSAGGYHHHMAMNTWNSAGAGLRVPALGLESAQIVVPSTEDVAALGARLRDHGVAARNEGNALFVDDPWKNLIEVRAAG